jgi:hypothetical protein
MLHVMVKSSVLLAAPGTVKPCAGTLGEVGLEPTKSEPTKSLRQAFV